MRTLHAFVLTLLFTSAAFAQDGFDLFKLSDQGGSEESVQATVQSALLPGEKEGVVTLAIKVTIPDGANIYSQTTKGAKPTKITVNAKGWTPLDDKFQPDHPAKKAFDEVLQAEVEKFVKEVTFERRYLAPSSVNPEEAQLTGKIDFLICKDLCLPQSEEFTAKYDPDGLLLASAPATSVSESPASEKPKNVGMDIFSAGADDQPSLTAPVIDVPTLTGNDSQVAAGDDLKFAYKMTPTREKRGQAMPDPVTLQFELKREGDEATLAITMKLDEKWNTYALKPASENQLERPTVLKVDATGMTSTSEFDSVPAPKIHESKLGDEVMKSAYHDKQVTWKKSFHIDDANNFGLTGSIVYQLCEKDAQCIRPNQVEFSLGASQNPEHVKGAETPGSLYVDAAALDKPTPPEGQLASSESDFEISAAAEVTSLNAALLSAFFAGLIMNVMPCVLPVLAIKILGFVQQAGESRGKVIALNLTYTAGVMAVFMFLALTSVIIGNSLSDIFQNTAFMVSMTVVVFAMGLSLFGVFDLPVPILPSANHHSEGYMGAFNTGIIATILGTPCIAPFVVPFWAYTLKQSTPTVFLIFAAMGVGMASPYLLTGFIPGLVNWLPKPGLWMVKFKHFTGFVMMGTVIWLIYGLPRHEAQMPTLVLLLAVGLFLWMISNLSDHSTPTGVKWRNHAISTATVLPVLLFGLWWLNYEDKIEWKPFSEQQMVALREDETPMLIDFTASWCAICKVNEVTALNTDRTAEFVSQHGFVTMVADFSDEDPEIKKWLNVFKQESVPLTVIIPGDKSKEVIPLRGRFTQAELLTKLQEAVGSPTQTAQVSTSTATH